MNGAAAVFFAAAIVIWCAPAVALAAVFVAERRATRADRKRRAEQGREVTPEWLAVLAAVEPTPTYDALVCEHMERAEGWA